MKRALNIRGVRWIAAMAMIAVVGAAAASEQKYALVIEKADAPTLDAAALPAEAGQHPALTQGYRVKLEIAPPPPGSLPPAPLPPGTPAPPLPTLGDVTWSVVKTEFQLPGSSNWGISGNVATCSAGVFTVLEKMLPRAGTWRTTIKAATTYRVGNGAARPIENTLPVEVSAWELTGVKFIKNGVEYGTMALVNGSTANAKGLFKGGEPGGDQRPEWKSDARRIGGGKTVSWQDVEPTVYKDDDWRMWGPGKNPVKTKEFKITALANGGAKGPVVLTMWPDHLGHKKYKFGNRADPDPAMEAIKKIASEAIKKYNIPGATLVLGPNATTYGGEAEFYNRWYEHQNIDPKNGVYYWWDFSVDASGKFDTGEITLLGTGNTPIPQELFNASVYIKVAGAWRIATLIGKAHEGTQVAGLGGAGGTVRVEVGGKATVAREMVAIRIHGNTGLTASSGITGSGGGDAQPTIKLTNVKVRSLPLTATYDVTIVGILEMGETYELAPSQTLFEAPNITIF